MLLGVFKKSKFGAKILNDKLPLPPMQPLANTSNADNFPYFFVADAAFPLTKNIMKPFPGLKLTNEQEYYNKRISRARRTIENAFGILVARWRILLSTLYLHPNNAEDVVLACIALHNFVMFHHPNNYCSSKFVDWDDENGIIQPGEWREQTNNNNLISCERLKTQHIYGGTSTTKLREKLCHFFDTNKIYSK